MSGQMDEYDPEAKSIAARLPAASSQNDAQNIVHEEFVHWFGETVAGPRELYKEVAADIWEIWLSSLVDQRDATEERSAADSASFQEVLELLAEPEVSRLTGVELTTAGKVLSVVAIQTIRGLHSGDGSEEKDGDKGHEVEGDGSKSDDRSDTVWTDIDSDEADYESDDDDDDDSEESEKKDTNEAEQQRNLLLSDSEAVEFSRRTVSYSLQARLLDICSSVCYLLGDGSRALLCLRNALAAHECAEALAVIRIVPELISTEGLRLIPCADMGASHTPSSALSQDLKLKLGALLTDMDEPEEAKLFLKAVINKDSQSVYGLVHLAEYHIQQDDFELAVQQLSRAQDRIKSDHYFKWRNTRPESASRGNRSLSAAEKKHALEWESHASLLGTVYSLLTMSLFRVMPQTPDVAMQVIREGLELVPDSAYMLLCLGEMHCQMGDAVAALQTFSKVNALEPDHPMPFLNAARVYQQLGQRREAVQHMQMAVDLDPSLALTRVDLAQHHLHLGHSEEAMRVLDGALALARHVSEIRDVLTARTVAKVQLELQRQKQAALVNV